MRIKSIGLGIVTGLFPATALANVNIPVASRVIGFIQPAPSGVINAAIVFEPGNATSEAEAAAIEQQVGVGLPVGRFVLRVHRVPATSLGGLAGTKLAFVTVGVREQQQVAEIANRQSILTITSDAGCVQAGRCVVGITGATKPQITVSRAAAKSANIRFGSAFLMLVKEL